MDYLVYFDNSNDRLSLLDMIEVDSQATDMDDKWHLAGQHFNESLDGSLRVGRPSWDEPRSNMTPLIDDSCWSDYKTSRRPRDSVDGTMTVGSMNRDPHLLVNPRTVAPVLDNSGVQMTHSTNFISIKPEPVDTVDIEPRAKVIKIEPACSKTFSFSSPPHHQFVSFATVAQQPAGTILTVAPSFTGKINSLPLFLQVATTVGNPIQTDGLVCIVKLEPEEKSQSVVEQPPQQQPQPMELKTEPTSIVPAETDAIDGAEMGNSDSISADASYEKPVFSYSCLIAMALKNSDTGSLPVNEIYAYILEKFPYFKSAPDGWKNSIRHNLSLNKCFEKIENPTVNGGSRKGCLWGLNPAKADKMDEEIAKWIKRAARANGSLKQADFASACAMRSNGVFAGAMDDDAVSDSAALLPSTPTFNEVCSDQPSSDRAAQPEFTMLEDSFTSDPMLAGLAVENGLWDDLTESDELKSVAMSFEGSQIAAKSQQLAKQRAAAASAAAAVSRHESTSVSLPSTSVGPTCRASHSKVTIAASGRLTSVTAPSGLTILNQPAIC